MGRETWTTELRQIAAAGASLMTLVTLAAAGLWPFNEAAPTSRDPWIVELVVGDRMTIGLIRTGILAVAAYVAASVPALVIDRRWIQGMTTGGLTTDAARDAQRWKDDLEARVDALAKALLTQSDQDAGSSRVLGSDDADDLRQSDGAGDED